MHFAKKSAFCSLHSLVVSRKIKCVITPLCVWYRQGTCDVRKSQAHEIHYVRIQTQKPVSGSQLLGVVTEHMSLMTFMIQSSLFQWSADSFKAELGCIPSWIVICGSVLISGPRLSDEGCTEYGRRASLLVLLTFLVLTCIAVCLFSVQNLFFRYGNVQSVLQYTLIPHPSIALLRFESYSCSD